MCCQNFDGGVLQPGYWIEKKKKSQGVRALPGLGLACTLATTKRKSYM